MDTQSITNNKLPISPNINEIDHKPNRIKTKTCCFGKVLVVLKK